MKETLCKLINTALASGCEEIRPYVKELVQEYVRLGDQDMVKRLRGILLSCPPKKKASGYVRRAVGVVCPKDANVIVGDYFCRHICRERVGDSQFEFCLCKFKG